MNQIATAEFTTDFVQLEYNIFNPDTSAKIISIRQGIAQSGMYVCALPVGKYIVEVLLSGESAGPYSLGFGVRNDLLNNIPPTYVNTFTYPTYNYDEPPIYNSFSSGVLNVTEPTYLYAFAQTYTLDVVNNFTINVFELETSEGEVTYTPEAVKEKILNFHYNVPSNAAGGAFWKQYLENLSDLF